MKSALVVEGGAMRGIFAAGVLDVFMEKHEPLFDFALGVSAGATNLAAYVTEQPIRSKNVILHYATRREFFNPIRLMAGGHMTDVHWLWHYADKKIPIERTRISHGLPLFVGVTRVDSGQAEYIRVNEQNLDEVMVASCALPLVYRHQPEINGIPYVDGGAADAIPVRQAYAMGARDITVILSQPLGYEKKPAKAPWLLEKMFKDQPKLLNTMLQRYAIYNETLAFIKAPPKDCRIRMIVPDESFAVKRLTMNKDKLIMGYDMGRQLALDYLSSPSDKAA